MRELNVRSNRLPVQCHHILSLQDERNCLPELNDFTIGNSYSHSRSRPDGTGKS